MPQISHSMYISDCNQVGKQVRIRGEANNVTCITF